MTSSSQKFLSQYDVGNWFIVGLMYNECLSKYYTDEIKEIKDAPTGITLSILRLAIVLVTMIYQIQKTLILFCMISIIDSSKFL